MEAKLLHCWAVDMVSGWGRCSPAPVLGGDPVLAKVIPVIAEAVKGAVVAAMDTAGGVGAAASLQGTDTPVAKGSTPTPVAMANWG